MKSFITLFFICILTTNSFADTSRENRSDKKTLTALYPFGFSSPSSASGIEVGKYLSEQQIISIQGNVTYNLGVSSRYDEDDESLSSSEMDEKAEQEAKLRDGQGYNIGVYYKQFFGNSFYIKPGIYYQSQYIVDEVQLGDDSEVLSTEEGHYKLVGISFKIGQSWHWESFLIGCDWFGISRSIALFEKTGNLDDNELIQASLLNFYVGMSF